MMFLIFILAPLIELFMLVEFVSKLGWVDTLAIHFLSGLIGFLLISTASFSRQELRSVESLSSQGVRFLAGILFIVPGLLSDAFALLILFPITRWLVWTFIKTRFLRSMANSNFRVYTKTSQSNPFQTGAFTTEIFNSEPLNKSAEDIYEHLKPEGFEPTARREREARIIDVKLIESSKSIDDFKSPNA